MTLEEERLVYTNGKGHRFVEADAALPDEVSQAANALIETAQRHEVGLGHTLFLIQGLWPVPSPQRQQNDDPAALTEPGDNPAPALVEHPQWQLNSLTAGLSHYRPGETAAATSTTNANPSPNQVDHRPDEDVLPAYWKTAGWVDQPPQPQDWVKEDSADEDDTTEDYSPDF